MRTSTEPASTKKHRANGLNSVSSILVLLKGPLMAEDVFALPAATVNAV
jgi:hypothetical protein